jgi:hypothetical protein
MSEEGAYVTLDPENGASCSSEMSVYVLTVSEHTRPLSTQCHEKLKS